jgi:hypothetical protein
MFKSKSKFRCKFCTPTKNCASHRRGKVYNKKQDSDYWYKDGSRRTFDELQKDPVFQEELKQIFLKKRLDLTDRSRGTVVIVGMMNDVIGSGYEWIRYCDDCGYIVHYNHSQTLHWLKNKKQPDCRCHRKGSTRDKNHKCIYS